MLAVHFFDYIYMYQNNSGSQAASRQEECAFIIIIWYLFLYEADSEIIGWWTQPFPI